MVTESGRLQTAKKLGLPSRSERARVRELGTPRPGDNSHDQGLYRRKSLNSYVKDSWESTSTIETSNK
jgi:hypothetical protein